MMVTTPNLVVGDTLDLGCRFGDQIRLKCPVCTRYLKRNPGPSSCSRCGTGFQPLTETLHEITRLPDD